MTNPKRPPHGVIDDLTLEMNDEKQLVVTAERTAEIVWHADAVTAEIWQDIRYAAAAGGVVALTDLTAVFEPALQHYMWWPVAAAAFRIGVNWLRQFAHRPADTK